MDVMGKDKMSQDGRSSKDEEDEEEEQFQQQTQSTRQISPSKVHRVLLGLGSNLGNKDTTLAQALQHLQNLGRIVSQSSLFRTAPQYVIHQPLFYNLICCLETKLSAVELLEACKALEVLLGRAFLSVIEQELQQKRFGPRSIDIDVLLFDDVILSECQTAVGMLTVPHPRMHERDFVLRPCMDVAPDWIHPVTQQTLRHMYEIFLEQQRKLPKEDRPAPPRSILPIGENACWEWKKKTYVMGVLNATPDSFSDGREVWDDQQVTRAIQVALEMEKNGCDIVDIGGESTRPGATPVTEEEELKRVLCVIRGIRKHSSMLLSIDTTKATVARAAIEAGANFINDVSGATLDPNMLSTVARLGVPIILMHRRGTPQTMLHLKTYDDLISEVSEFLNERVEAAMQLGIPRWRIILDPGIGFAKGQKENIFLLKHLNDVIQRCHNLPFLVGTSRKGFIGDICGKENPVDRDWGTAATCCAAIQQGVDIIRVHHVSGMVDVAKMYDAIFRSETQAHGFMNS